MEIKVNLRLETLLNVVHFLEKMELETAALLMVGVLLLPFVIFSFWSLMTALLCQLFWLGVKAGLLLFLVCGCYMAFLLMSRMNSAEGVTSKKRNCTLGDILLSVFFQTGLRIPPFIWDYFMVISNGEGLPGKGPGVEKDIGNKNKTQQEMWAEFQQQLDEVVESLDGGLPPPPPASENRTTEDSPMAIDEGWNSEDIIGGSGDCPYSSNLSDEELIRQVIMSSNLELASSNIDGGAAVIGSRRRLRGGGDHVFTFTGEGKRRCSRIKQ